ncbi:hypothetical protein D9M73_154740 [compost metagenome]
MNGAHAHFFLFQLALVHQPAPDRPVGMAVLVGVTQAQLAAVFQLYPAGTLDLQELQVHRVGQPGQHRCLDAVTVDHLGGVVRFEHPAIETTAQALALELGVHAGQVDHDHVIRDAVDRHMVGCRLAQAAWVDRLVVASDQAVGIVIGGAQAVDIQVLLEETANVIGALRHVGRRCAGAAPDRVGLEPGAGAAPRAETGDEVAVGDCRQRFPGGAGVGGQGVGLRLFVFAAGAACEHGHDRKRPGQGVTPGLDTAVHEVIPLPVA